MEIRNLMEDRVIRLVNEICDEDERIGAMQYCTSPQCRLDAVCFVLNRIPQRYVTSGRGFAHLEKDINENLQLSVDMVAIAHEGLQRVTSIQRSFYDSNDQDEDQELCAKWYYYFPTIKGRVFNGMSFEPLAEVEVLLQYNNRPVAMIDKRWVNPYSTMANSPGTFLFWPKPLCADGEGVQKSFEFSIEVDDIRFESFRHYATITLQSEPYRSPRSFIRDVALPDLFVIPRSEEVGEMQYYPSDDPL